MSYVESFATRKCTRKSRTKVVNLTDSEGKRGVAGQADQAGRRRDPLHQPGGSQGICAGGCKPLQQVHCHYAGVA